MTPLSRLMAGRLRLQWGLRERLLGVLGLGRLGAMTANVAIHGFGMKVTARSVNLTQKKADEQAKSLGLPAGSFTAVGSKKEFIQRVDILTIHYVLSA
jgi:lactate dehydrogenase-like 2-hydroxyacid dehydrogenase